MSQVNTGTRSEPQADTLEWAAHLTADGDIEGAIAVYGRLASNPAAAAAAAVALTHKGLLHVDLGDAASARTSLEQAAALAPYDGWIAFHLGQIASSLGRPAAAAAHYKTALNLEPRNDEFRINLANISLSLQHLDYASSLVESMKPDLPGWWAGVRDRTRAQLADAKARLDALGEAKERGPALDRAELLIVCGQFDAGVSICQRLIGEDPADFGPVATRIKEIIFQRGAGAARDYLGGLSRHFAGNPVYEAAAARLAYEDGDYAGALKHRQAAGEKIERRLRGLMLLAAGAWEELLTYTRDWMTMTDDTSPFSLSLRAAQGTGELQLVSREASVQPGEGRIPRTIVQFWDNEAVPDDVATVVETWRTLNPDYTHRLFSERAAADYIAEHYGERAARAFGACHHPAMKSDFFRICVIAREGGIYIDVDEACRIPLDVLLSRLGHASLALPLSGDIAPYIHNSFILASPGSPVLTLAYEDLMAGVERAVARGAKADIWHTTGPGLLTRAAARYLARPDADRSELRFLTTRQYRSFAAAMDGLDYKKTTAGNWHIARAKPTAKVASVVAGPTDILVPIRPDTHVDYRAFLERFMRMNAVRSIVELGCGDWQVNRHLDLLDADYCGYDADEMVVAENVQRFGSDAVRFEPLPKDLSALPHADLLILRNALPLLAENMLADFKNMLLGRYRFAVLTHAATIDGVGEAVDLTAAPYTLPGAYFLDYRTNAGQDIRLFLAIG